jgi:heme/copper-type cytochrome/quinol oxidase subunit 3
VVSRIRNELAAAVAIGAGILLASGYAVAWARLHSAHVPTETVMSALPTSFFLGVAVQAVLLPAVVLIVTGFA